MFFNNVPPDKQSITIHDLLRHQSGLVSNVGGDFDSITTSAFLDKVLSSKLKLDPGKRFSYSNVGYSLLAMIIEKVSGKTYETYLYENLWKPSHMETTGYTRPAFDNNLIAVGYSDEDKWGKPTDKQWDKDGPFWHLKGNGGILSTTEDMFKWHSALRSENILSKEAKQKLYHPELRPDESYDSYYAYGWDISKTKRNTIQAWHSGTNRVFYAEYLRYPDEGVAIIMLSNRAHLNYFRLTFEIAPDGQSVVWAKYLGGTAWESNENSVRIGPDEHPYILFTTESSGIATSGAYDETYGGSQDFFINRIDNVSGNILWGSYLGGSGNESTETHEFAVDLKGNAYVSGPTKSGNYPVTNGAFQTTFIGPAGFNDIVVSKISADGDSLLASTYIGGNGADRTEGIDVTDDGRVFITGTTTSTDFPLTSNAIQTTINGGRDAFAVVVASDFTSLDYSTLIGSTGADYGRCADVDHNGNLLLGGDAPATGWPLAGNGQPFHGGSGDAIIAKFSITSTSFYDKLNNNSFNLFPNPGGDEILIDLAYKQKQVQVKIFNSVGQLQFNRSYNEVQTLHLNTENFSTGIYYIVLLTDKNIPEGMKWIKN